MSRIGTQPITLPSGVRVEAAGSTVTVIGPEGTLARAIRPEVRVIVLEGSVSVVPAASSRKMPAYWGLTRALIAGMVEGVSRGFEKKLEIEGIGYRAAVDGSNLQLALGFSHPVRLAAPPGISFQVERNTITVSGIDKVLVGDVAARIRNLRPPEPYKGKGIRYRGEVVRRKAGKKAATTGS
ncbi:MAG: 50S ribosomal protein L6 [Patescibacteria group bacterium]